MTRLLLDSVHEYLLGVLDELGTTKYAPMMGEEEVGDANTYQLVEQFIDEAIIKSHQEAPAHLLDGQLAEQGNDYSVTITDNVAYILFYSDMPRMVRLVSLKASDSPYVVTDYASEDSSIGRMQHNPYVRGTYDDPRLIAKARWEEDGVPEFYYYSVKDANATFEIEYIPYPIPGDDRLIAGRMEYAVLNLVVSMILDSLSEHEKAVIYKNKYQEYLQTAK